MIEVQAVDFTACLEQYGIPYYLKIDIEGMDTLCLKALLPFPEKPDYVSLESDKKHFSGLKNEFNLLCDLGYNAFQIVNQGLVPMMKEPLDTREGTYTGQVFTPGNSGLFGKDLPAFGWVRRNEALMGYRKLFVKYFFYGDVDRSAYLESRFWGRYYMRILRMCIGSVCWYDTHACRIDESLIPSGRL